MTEEKIEINRTLVGVLSLVCLGLAGVIFWQFGGDDSWTMWQAGFTRVGLVLAGLWIALPSKGREAAWAHVSGYTLAGIVVALLLLMRLQLRVVLPLFIVLSIIGLLLRPRPKRRPPGR